MRKERRSGDLPRDVLLLRTGAVCCLVALGVALWFFSPAPSSTELSVIGPTVPRIDPDSFEPCEQFSLTDPVLDAVRELPASCKVALGGSAGEAIVTFLPSGQIDIVAMEKQGEGADSFFLVGKSLFSSRDFYTEEPPFSPPNFMFSHFSFDDLTFDGYADLSLLDWYGPYSISYSYFAYNPQTKKFYTMPFLSARNPKIDARQRTIVSDTPGRGIRDIYTKETYTFTDGSYQLSERIVQEENPDCTDSSCEGAYLYTIERLAQGKLQLVSREVLPEPRY